MLRVRARVPLREFALAVDLDVPNGVTVVAGPSGSGKTTLLRIVAGLVRPREGTVVLGGRILTGPGIFVPPFARDIGLVFQEYALFPHLDVARNVGYGLRARGVARGERERRVRAMLEQLDLGALAGARVGELSGGQRQRVALGRALVIAPAALLLDEPLAALDPTTRDRVREELRATLDRVAIPTLLVTHDAADQEAFAGRVVRLDRGRLVAAP